MLAVSHEYDVFLPIAHRSVVNSSVCCLPLLESSNENACGEAFLWPVLQDVSGGLASCVHSRTVHKPQSCTLNQLVSAICMRMCLLYRHGTDGDSTEGEMLPLKRALQDSLRALQTPFQAPDWNRTGRYVCRRDTLLQWLENDESQRVLHLSNAELPAEVLSRKR